MDIPRYSRELPEICVPTSNTPDRYRSSSSRSSSFNSNFSPPTSAIPMSIPNARDSPPPPPLPPPKYPDLDNNNDGSAPDIAWQWSNSREEGGGWGRPSPSINPGSSLYGSFHSRGKSITEERPDFDRRGSSASTIKSISGVDARQDYPRIDEGYASLSGTSIGSNQSRREELGAGRPGFFQSSMHETFRSNAQAYDKSLLQKLDSRRVKDNSTPPRGYSRTSFSSSLNEPPRSRPDYDYHDSNLKPLSLPVATSRVPFTESPLSRWANGGTSATSPRDQYSFGPQANYNYRSPREREEIERSPLPFIRRSENGSILGSEDNSNFASRSARGSYDQNSYAESDPDFPMEETTGLRRLRIDDNSGRFDGHSPSSTAGQKRRASSPPREDGLPALHTVSSASDLFRRRESASRSSPVPRLHSNHGSISSTASGPRSNSYASTLSLAASSMTTMSSYGRLSPGGFSPGGLSPGALSPGGLSPGGISPGGLSPRSIEGGIESPYQSPRGSVSRPGHQRTASHESRHILTPRKSSDTIHAGKTGGGFMCECCPKKPKKFETEEDLRAHEQEKQYECAYCKNRFKNKNEAERHQNSLHLRRHSWSCASLAGYSAAFHVSSSRPKDADACGYCGEEFLRTGPLTHHGDKEVKSVTERDWEARIQHLTEVHKFGECNHAKKFFRADHFRQHLKHSHAGTSGKWTNMLENACMKDEPIPDRITEESEL